MALVRCPTHKIPYNDENPRGCPACAAEREGGGQAAIMKELARATRRALSTPPGAGRPETVDRGEEPAASAPAPSAPGAPPVTAPPQTPAEEVGRLEETLWQLGRPRTIVAGAATIIVLAAILVLTGRPRFIPDPRPAPFDGAVRPLPILPNTPVTTVFAVLGTRAPETHPTAPNLARYSYGTDLVVDALNGQVYALSFGVPNRSWNGLRVGTPHQQVEGTLALLAPPVDEGVETPIAPRAVGDYTVYPSLDSLPARTLTAAVRPPNGCYDVRVTLQPPVTGQLADGDRRYVVVGEADAPPPDWVATRVDVVSRAMAGPYAGPPRC